MTGLRPRADSLSPNPSLVTVLVKAHDGSPSQQLSRAVSTRGETYVKPIPHLTLLERWLCNCNLVSVSSYIHCALAAAGNEAEIALLLTRGGFVIDGWFLQLDSNQLNALSQELAGFYALSSTRFASDVVNQAV